MLFSNGLVPYLIATYGLEGTSAYAVWGVGLFLCILIPYLLGSLNFAIIISRVVYKDDIRRYGSGNAGATNMLRTYGKGAALGAFVGDLLKTVIGVLFGSITLGYFLGGGCIAGFFCVLGHVFPIFSHFRGGKGVSSAAAVAILMNVNSLSGLLLIGILLLMFIIIVAGTKYVSLGSVSAIILYPVVLHGAFGFIDSLSENPIPESGLIALSSIIVAILTVWCHRANLQRISDRTENKISFKKKVAEPEEEEAKADDEE